MADRPLDCAAYPFALDDGIITIGRRRLPYCPPGAWTPALIDAPRDAQRLRQRDRERAAWDAVLAHWHIILPSRGAAGSKEFLDWTVATYARLEARAPALFDPSLSELPVAAIRPHVEQALS